jgi:hypothetical protein
MCVQAGCAGVAGSQMTLDRVVSVQIDIAAQQTQIAVDLAAHQAHG